MVEGRGLSAPALLRGYRPGDIGWADRHATGRRQADNLQIAKATRRYQAAGGLQQAPPYRGAARGGMYRGACRHRLLVFFQKNEL